MFHSCYRGGVPIKICRAIPHRAPVDRRSVRQSRSPAFDIAGVRLDQLSNTGGLNHIDDILAVAETCRRVSPYKTCVGEKFKMSIQAGSANIHRSLESPNGRRAEHREATQDIYASAVAHETDCRFNFGRQFWSNQTGHGSILPDSIENQRLLCRPTLLLCNRVCSGLTQWPA